MNKYKNNSKWKFSLNKDTVSRVAASARTPEIYGDQDNSSIECHLLSLGTELSTLYTLLH